MRFPLVLAASLFSTAAPAQPLVAEAPLRAHLSFLADDLLEGRGTGQRGGDLACLLYTSPSPRDATLSRMPSSA